jgi:hypothetical protein
VKSGAIKPIVSAASQSTGRSAPWTKPATTISAAPAVDNGATRAIAASRSRSPRAESAYNAACITITIRNVAPKTTPCRPNASGTASAATNIAPIATTVVPQTRASPGSTVFVSQA